MGEDNKDIFEAWVAKFEQVYKKGLIIFENDKDSDKLQQIYEEFYINVNNEKAKKINDGNNIDEVEEVIAVNINNLFFI